VRIAIREHLTKAGLWPPADVTETKPPAAKKLGGKGG
jgi:hypothetical protein